jgi:hypothetical protein
VGPLHRLATLGLDDHVGEGETGEVLAHVVTDVGPYSEQDALTLVITRAVAVGLTEVTRDDWSVHCRDDLGERDGFGASRQDVTAPDPSFGANESYALQTEKNLLEIGLG